MCKNEAFQFLFYFFLKKSHEFFLNLLTWGGECFIDRIFSQISFRGCYINSEKQIACTCFCSCLNSSIPFTILTNLLILLSSFLSIYTYLYEYIFFPLSLHVSFKLNCQYYNWKVFFFFNGCQDFHFVHFICWFFNYFILHNKKFRWLEKLFYVFFKQFMC